MPGARYSEKLRKWLVPTGTGGYVEAPDQPPPPGMEPAPSMQQAGAGRVAGMKDVPERASTDFLPGLKAGLTAAPSTLAGAFGGIRGAVSGAVQTARGGRLPGYEDKPLAGIGEFMRRAYEDSVEKTEAKNAASMEQNPLAYGLGKMIQGAPIAAAAGPGIPMQMLAGAGLGAAESGQNPLKGAAIGGAAGLAGGLAEKGLNALGVGLLKHGGAASVKKFGPKIGEIVDQATANGATVPWNQVEGELRSIQGPLQKSVIPQAKGVGSQVEEIINNIKNERATPNPGGYETTYDMTPRALHDTKGELAEFAGFHKARQTPGQEALGRMTGVAKGLEENAIQQGAPERFAEFQRAKEIYGPALEGKIMADNARGAGLLGPSGALRLQPIAGAIMGGAAGGPAGGLAGLAAGYGARKFGPTVGQRAAYMTGLPMRALAPTARMTAPAGLQGVNLVKWLMDQPESEDQGSNSQGDQ